MTRRAPARRRSAREWGARVVLAIALLLAGGWATAQSLGLVLARTDSAAGHRVAPANGRITSALSVALSMPEAGSSDRTRSDALARLALRQDATAVAAASTLGLNSQLRGDSVAARRQFAYAERLSRRDTRTQLWAIEDAVGRGDIPGALRHYDIALRTQPKLSELLFPVLAAAAADPAVRPGLARTIARGAPWGADFARYLAVNNADPRATAQLFGDLRRGGFAVPKAARAGAIYGLITRGDAEAAWAYYHATGATGARDHSRDPRFAGMDTPTPFDWVAVNEGAVSTAIQNGIFDFAAPSSVGGVLLQQVQALPSGDYRLVGHSEGIDQVEGARPYWTLTCRGGTELGRVTIPNSASNGGRFAGALKVPAGCPIQTLALVAPPSNAISGLSGRIDRAELVPAR